MEEYYGFKDCGNWHKGNIHSHTTVPDGMLTPEQSVALYGGNGYHFICPSEHDIFTNFREQFNTKTFIIPPAVESSVVLYRAKGTNGRYKVHRLHGILRTQAMWGVTPLGTYGHMQCIPPMKFFGEWTGAQAAQETADMLRDHGCVATYNHPIWSRVTEKEFIHMEGTSVLEIPNYSTVQESNMGYNVTYWDRMLCTGGRVSALASDDNHNEELSEDPCGGWICVQAPDLNHDSIVQNFMEGNYYSSSGPETYDWGVEDGKVLIDASGMNHVNFVCENIISDGTVALGERFRDTLNRNEYTLKGHEIYIWVEAMDKYGRTTWVNPVYLE